jgi:hypothetical protein
MFSRTSPDLAKISYDPEKVVRVHWFRMFAEIFLDSNFMATVRGTSYLAV